VFAAALRAVTSEKSQNDSQRLFLTLREAAALSGLSQACLRRLIADGSLEARRDRGWRIRRRDLERL
jgi:excisionase family DNA binding protein